MRPVGFGVVAARGELAHLREVDLGGIVQRAGGERRRQQQERSEEGRDLHGSAMLPRRR